MTMKTPEDLRTFWTECFAQNDLNGMYGTKCFENETKSFGNGTKRFKNGTLLRCSAVQSLYMYMYEDSTNLLLRFYYILK